MRDQIDNICWIMEKAREFQKIIYFCFIDYAKAFDCVDHRPLRGLQETRVATREESGVLGFPSNCEGKLGVALESLQGPRDLT